MTVNDVEIKETWGTAGAYPSTHVEINGHLVLGAKVMTVRKGAVTITIPTTTLRMSYGEAALPPAEVEE